MNHADGAFFNTEASEEDSVSSNDEHVPLPDVLPPQLADTPGLLLRSLGLAPPRPPATTASSSEKPKPRVRGGSAKKKKKESTGQNPKSAETEATAPPRKKRKPAPDPKNWVPRTGLLPKKEGRIPLLLIGNNDFIWNNKTSLFNDFIDQLYD